MKTEYGHDTEFFSRDEENRLCPTKIGRFVSEYKEFSYTLKTRKKIFSESTNIGIYCLKTSF